MSTEPTAKNETAIGMRDKMVMDLKTVVEDADHLLRQTAAPTLERLDLARARIEDKIGEVRHRFDSTCSVASARARGAANATQGFVKEHPWQVVGLVAVLGLLVSVLRSKR